MATFKNSGNTLVNSILNFEVKVLEVSLCVSVTSSALKFVNGKIVNRSVKIGPKILDSGTMVVKCIKYQTNGSLKFYFNVIF